MAQDSSPNLSDAHTQQRDLKGLRAIITGGTTGIGRATGVLLASYGVKIFTCGRTPEHLDDAMARYNEVGEAKGTTCDLSKQEDLERFFREADEYLGGLDIAIINAAVSAEGLTTTSAQDARYQLETDFMAYVLTAKAATERLKAGGDVVLVGSMSAVSREPDSSVYVAAKSGIQGFAVALRKELAEKDIKVGLIEPGFTGADLQYPDFPPERQREQIHQDKMLRAEDIAVAIHFMLNQPRRTAVSHMRVETRLKHED